jgi:hypothetical protein
MTPEQTWTIAGAVLASLAGGGAIVLALSSWLARSWARRMLEEDRARYHAELDAVKHTYTHELERLKDDLEASNRKLHGHLNHAVLVSRPRVGRAPQQSDASQRHRVRNLVRQGPGRVRS